MSIATTERTGSIRTAIEFGIKLMTGLLIVSAAFLTLLAIQLAVATPETEAALQMLLQ
ncbi:MAG TPA: hypothetical protein VLJ17_15700 [Xanthobacteraceae bacterium]|nr:hypothetical protein [Xanthobacteraceae bacterium]